MTSNNTLDRPDQIFISHGHATAFITVVVIAVSAFGLDWMFNHELKPEFIDDIIVSMYNKYGYLAIIGVIIIPLHWGYTNPTAKKELVAQCIPWIAVLILLHAMTIGSQYQNITGNIVGIAVFTFFYTTMVLFFPTMLLCLIAVVSTWAGTYLRFYRTRGIIPR